MLGVLPWFLPGVGLSLIVAVLVSGRVGRWLSCNRLIAALLIISLGIVLSATITPLGTTSDPSEVVGPGCDLSRVALAPLEDLWSLNDASLNIMLFVPLGVAVGLLPGSPRKVAVVIAALLAPFAVELFQLLVPVLGRGCQSADVIDNLTGLIVGMAGATAARLLLSRIGPMD